MSRVKAIEVARGYNSPLFETAKVAALAGLVFTAGLVAVDENGAPVCEDDFAGQARATLAAVREAVESAGSSLDRIVKLLVFVTDMDQRPVFVAIREEVFGGRIPPISMVEVSRLANPAFLIEIEAVAAL